jgi:hypothetical protein
VRLRRELRGRVVAGERSGRRRLKIPGQQLVDAVDRVIGESREHFSQKRLGIVAVEFGGAQQTVDGSSVITAGIAAGEQIVLALMQRSP